jgi:hypothetical protein
VSGSCGVVAVQKKLCQKNWRVQAHPLERDKEQVRRTLRRKEKRISSSQLPHAHWPHVNAVLLFLASRLRVRFWRSPRLWSAAASRVGLWLAVARLHRRQQSSRRGACVNTCSHRALAQGRQRRTSRESGGSGPCAPSGVPSSALVAATSACPLPLTAGEMNFCTFLLPPATSVVVLVLATRIAALNLAACCCAAMHRHWPPKCAPPDQPCARLWPWWWQQKKPGGVVSDWTGPCVMRPDPGRWLWPWVCGLWFGVGRALRAATWRSSFAICLTRFAPPAKGSRPDLAFTEARHRRTDSVSPLWVRLARIGVAATRPSMCLSKAGKDERDNLKWL